MMTQSRVRHSDIEPGKPMPWDVYDEKGNLLLAQGHIIARESQVDRLVAMGVYADTEVLRKFRIRQSEAEDAEGEPLSPMQAWLDLRIRLDRLYDTLERNVPSGTQLAEVVDIAVQVDKLCAAKPELSQAIISLRQEGRYSTRHMLDCAAIVRLAARALKLSPAREQSAICAALTMNLGTTTFQDEIKTQTSALSEVQKENLRTHPDEAAGRLNSLGVTDPIWLRAVRDHHEQFDGLGYPRGIAGAQLSTEGQLLRLADIYCARVTFREYRTAVPLTIALRDIMREGGKTVETTLAGKFIRAVGIFPPGLQLKLLNGEKGVVTRAGTTPNHPIVFSLLGVEGKPLVPGAYRDTQMPVYGVHETIDPTTFNAYVDINAIWG